MCTVIFSILVIEPFYDMRPSLFIKVQIYIWEHLPIRTHEAFKQQIVFQRVYLGYSQTVCDQTPCRCTTSWTNQSAQLFFCIVNYILYKQEVSFCSILLDDFQFKLETVIYFFWKWNSIDNLCFCICQMFQIVSIIFETFWYCN